MEFPFQLVLLCCQHPDRTTSCQTSPSTCDTASHQERRGSHGRLQTSADWEPGQALSDRARQGKSGWRKEWQEGRINRNFVRGQTVGGERRLNRPAEGRSLRDESRSPWGGNSTSDSELYAAGMLIYCFKLPLTPLFLSVFTRISAVSASNTWRMERW